MASYLVHDRLGPTGVKSVLSLDGALAIAQARGLTEYGATFVFHANRGMRASDYEDLDHVRAWLYQGAPAPSCVVVTKSEIDEHRNAGRAWKHHEFTMAKVWAVKIALSQTFDFPLESATADEWSSLERSQ